MLGYSFKKPELLKMALVHSSVGSRENYERLEFLGDRVLGLVVAEMLYRKFPKESEGALARRFAHLVRKETILRVAQDLRLGEELVLAKGENDTGGRQNASILSDACEAVIGAIFLDGGFDPAREFVMRFWEKFLSEDLTPPKDNKTALQEWAQSRGKPLPEYDVVSITGPDHSPVFLVEVTVTGLAPAQGEGASKRLASQNAAANLLQRIREKK